MLALDSKTESHQSHLPNHFLLDDGLTHAQCKGAEFAHGRVVCNPANQDAAPDVQDGDTKNKHDFWYINLLNETDAVFYRNFDQRFALNLDT